MPLSIGLRRTSRHYGATIAMGDAPPVRRVVPPPFRSADADNFTQDERTKQRADAWREFATDDARMFVADGTTGRSTNADSMVAAALRGAGKRPRPDGHDSGPLPQRRLITHNRYDGSDNAAPAWSLAQPLYATDPVARQRLHNGMQVEDTARREYIEHVSKSKAIGRRFRNLATGRETDPSESRPYVRTCDLGVSRTPMREAATIPQRSVLPLKQDPTAVPSRGNIEGHHQPVRWVEPYAAGADERTPTVVAARDERGTSQLLHQHAKVAAHEGQARALPGPERQGGRMPHSTAVGRRSTIGAYPTEDVRQAHRPSVAREHRTFHGPSGAVSSLHDTMTDPIGARNDRAPRHVQTNAISMEGTPSVYPRGVVRVEAARSSARASRLRLAALFDLEHWMEDRQTSREGEPVRSVMPLAARRGAALATGTGGEDIHRAQATHTSTMEVRPHLSDVAKQDSLPHNAARQTVHWAPSRPEATGRAGTAHERDQVQPVRRTAPHRPMNGGHGPLALGAEARPEPSVVRATADGGRRPPTLVEKQSAGASPLSLPLARDGLHPGRATEVAQQLPPAHTAVAAQSRSLVDGTEQRAGGRDALSNRVTGRGREGWERSSPAGGGASSLGADHRSPWLFPGRG